MNRDICYGNLLKFILDNAQLLDFYKFYDFLVNTVYIDS